MESPSTRSPYPKGTWAYAGLAASLTIVFVLLMAQQAGVMPAMIVGSAMAVSLIVWLLTTARYPANPKRALPIYMVTASLLMLHIGEEYVWEFGPRIGLLTGKPWSQGEFFVMFGVVFPTIWILAGALVYFRNPFGNWVIWFIYLGMILGEPVHLLVFPFAEGGRYHYFPGMFTALIPLVLGLWGISELLKDYRAAKLNSGGNA